MGSRERESVCASVCLCVRENPKPERPEPDPTDPTGSVLAQDADGSILAQALGRGSAAGAMARARGSAAAHLLSGESANPTAPASRSWRATCPEHSDLLERFSVLARPCRRQAKGQYSQLTLPAPKRVVYTLLQKKTRSGALQRTGGVNTKAQTREERRVAVLGSGGAVAMVLPIWVRS